MSGRKLSAEGERKLVDKLNQIPARQRTGGGELVGPDELGFWAQLTAFNDATGLYSWKRQKKDISSLYGFADLSPTQTGTRAFDAGWSSGQRVGQYVFLHHGYVDLDPESPHYEEKLYWFEGRELPIIRFKITSALAGDCYYGAKSFGQVVEDHDGDVDAAENHMGILSSEEDLVVFNMKEFGSTNTGHDLLEAINTDTFSVYGQGVLVRINASGKRLVHAVEFWAGCDPEGGA